jgi:hypothetical protein
MLVKQVCLSVLSCVFQKVSEIKKYNCQAAANHQTVHSCCSVQPHVVGCCSSLSSATTVVTAASAVTIEITDCCLLLLLCAAAVLCHWP